MKKRMIVLVIVLLLLTGCGSSKQKVVIKDHADLFSCENVQEYLEKNHMEAEPVSETSYQIVGGEKIGDRTFDLFFGENIGLNYSRKYTGSIKEDGKLIMEYYDQLVQKYGYGQTIDSDTLVEVDAKGEWKAFSEQLIDIMNHWDASFAHDEETGYLYQVIQLTWYEQHIVFRLHVSEDKDWLQLQVLYLSPEAWENSLYKR